MVTETHTTPAHTGKPPFLPSHPPFGNLAEFARHRLDLLSRMAAMGDVSGLHFGPFAGLLFNRPEHIYAILVEHAADFDKGLAIHATFRPSIGDGIFSSEGNFHRQQRKLIAPSFQPRQIVNYAESMADYSEKIQQTWTDQAVIDLNQQMTNLTMSVIGKTLFDADVFTETDDLGAAMTETFHYVSHRLTTLVPPPYAWPTPRNRRVHRAAKVLRDHIQGFVDERRKHPSEREDLLSLLLLARDENGQPMSDKQVLAECLTLFGAGHETTATTLTWAWYLLCQHPEAYEKLHIEVDTVLEGRTPTAADLARLPYSLQVFKEAMRLYPPAYAFSRTARRRVEIDGYRIARGSVVVLAPYTLHRRTDYFPNPTQFEPERFTPEREKLLPRYAYLPFGAGPRICIGMHFALMEGQLLLATLAQRTHFSLLPGQTIEPDPVNNLTLRPGRAVNVMVQKR